MPSMTDHIVVQLKGKKILILGFGREGQSTLRFLCRHLPKAQITIADAALPGKDHSIPENIRTLFGSHYLDGLSEAELIIKTPGIPTRLLQLRPGQQLRSQTDLFLSAFRHQTIGVTGTKGKSTTSALIYHLLSQAGKPVVLTGNIGTPCFDSIEQITPETTVVFELSANQLENVRHSPGVTVLLNIFEEHLDHFGSMDTYRQAKLNILRFCMPGDTAIVHRTLQSVIPPIGGQVHFFPEPAFHLPSLPVLRGEHNRSNAQAAILAAMATGFQEQELIPLLNSFKGLPHRLEYLGLKAGVHFYNDSIATIPEATVAALETLGKVNFLILGGFDRGIHYELLANYLLEHPVDHLLFTGQAGQRIASLLSITPGIMHLHFFEELKEAFEIISQNCHVGDICLLSPAAASYDRYKNFEQRGDLFRSLTETFSNKTS